MEDSGNLDAAARFFEENLSRLLKDPKYKDKYVAVTSNRVVNAYETLEPALKFAFSHPELQCYIGLVAKGGNGESRISPRP